MDINKDSKRKKDKNVDEDERRREKKSKRARSRSRSPADSRYKDTRHKRRRSRSRSPNVAIKHEKRGNDATKESEVRKEAPERPERRAKDTDMLNTRTGGAYIPPARLRMMQAQITDKSSMAYQRLAWEALKKSIHGHINKINVGNIGIIIKQLLKENIVRGRGLLCRSVIQAQAASPTFTNVYAALVAAVNSRFPNIGELLLKRLVIQFKRGYKRNDKSICISSVSFIAHLVNQRVAHEILALELLILLVETPTDDSVEVAIAFLKECGQKLTEVSSKGVNAIFEMLRNILHEGQLDKRVQYMIEVMFQVWKDGFKDHPALIEELELVPEEEQFTHLLTLDDAADPQDILNVFKFDEKYEENEQKYKTLSKEILGSDAESGEEDDGSGESGTEESEEEDIDEKKEVTIIDNTETNLVALRRTIYLTINSSLDFEECAHKLMKMQLKPGQEVELCHMFLDCCAEQRTYEKFYGLLAQRFCNINRMYIGPFEEIFKDSYATAHRLDTNRLRNVSKFFAHLLFTDSISWEVLECVRLNEEDTTSSSRIYIKILFQELAEYMGLKKLNDRLQDPTLQEAFSGIFPRDNPRNTRFSINFFTSIGLGGLTDELREHLKQMPKNVPAPITEINLDSSSESSSSSSSSSDDSSSSDSSSSDSDDETNNKKKDKRKSKKKDKSPKTPQHDEGNKDKNTERWGHDGFYDTYGKDARRTESRPERESHKGNYAGPRDVRKDERPEQRYYDRRVDRSTEESRRGRDDRRSERKQEEMRQTETDDGRHDRDEYNKNMRRRRNRDDRQNDENHGKKDNVRRHDKDNEGKVIGSSRERKSNSDEERKDSNKTGKERRRDEDDGEKISRSNRERKIISAVVNKDSSNKETEIKRNKGYREVDIRKHGERMSSSVVEMEDPGKNNTERRRNKNNEQRDRKRDRDKKFSSDEEEEDSSKKYREKSRDKEQDSRINRETKNNSYGEREDSSKHRKEKRREKDRSQRKSGSDDERNVNRYEKERQQKSRNKGGKESREEDNPRNDEGWDIRRGSSIRREMPGRYWDTYDIDKRIEREDGTPERRERNRDRTRQRS